MMEAAVDYKQYGNLDAMKDIIDARGNDKLTKKIPRKTILVNKIKGEDPFITSTGKSVIIKSADVDLPALEKIFNDKDRKALRTFKFGQYALSDFVKTPEFGGAPKGKFTAVEDRELEKAHEALQKLMASEAVPFIYLKVGSRVEKVDGMRTEKGTPKSDFNYTYQGNDVFFISHKDYKGNKVAFQQYGGMPEAKKFNPNSKDLNKFITDAQKYYAKFGGKFKTGHEIWRTVNDDQVWQKGLLGRDYKKGRGRSNQNVDGLFSGVLSYKNLNRKKQNIPMFELRGQGITLLHDTPKPTGIYEPVYYIRKETGKAAFGINDVRSFIYPIGGISKKIINDKTRNI
jgi:hypothetical protein